MEVSERNFSVTSLHVLHKHNMRAVKKMSLRRDVRRELTVSRAAKRELKLSTLYTCHEKGDAEKKES